MNQIRKQLTLFIEESNEKIEKIRAEFNPKQHNLISAHITLCREDEIESIDKIIQRIKSITLKKPIRIGFKSVERFSDGKGILIPATDKNIEFQKRILFSQLFALWIQFKPFLFTDIFPKNLEHSQFLI